MHLYEFPLKNEVVKHTSEVDLKASRLGQLKTLKPPT